MKNADCSVVQAVQVELTLKNSSTLLGKYQAKYIGLAFLFGVHPASSVNIKMENIALNCVPFVASSNTSGLEAHVDFFRLLMKWIFDPYVL